MFGALSFTVYKNHSSQLTYISGTAKEIKNFDIWGSSFIHNHSSNSVEFFHHGNLTYISGT
jgi:hypothetical protein